MHVRFGSMVRFHSLTQFPADYYSNSAMSGLVLFMFVALSYYVINRLMSISVLSTFAILLYIFALT